MDLDTYVAQLQQHRDASWQFLRDNYRVYDNYLVFVRDSFEQVATRLDALFPEAQHPAPAQVDWRVYELPESLFQLDEQVAARMAEGVDKHRQRQFIDNYRVTITLHPRDIASPLIRIVQSLQSDAIPFCLPRTVWSAHPEYPRSIFFPETDAF